ncbi:transglycosylase family protein, partial [Kitasatospora sp. NPDC059571]|uniref:transglycosylase family protein n=1 Tax=Kitasatospora sp. NPDC059571 TaxID=3346871 RepID=UPI00367DB2A5
MTTRPRRTPALALAGVLALAAPVLATGEASAASVSTWDKVADCESSGNWAINTGNGYYGGLQFSQSTWLGYGGGQYAAYPHQATKQQQILIGEKVLASQGQGAWPTCGPRAGLGADHADPYPSTSPPQASAPSLGDAGSVVAEDGTQYTFTRDAANGHLQVTYLPKGGNWTTADMTAMAGTPASAGGAPAAFVQKDGTVGVVTANAANGHVYMTYLPSGGQWTGADMTTLAGTPVSDGNVGNAIAADGTHYIFSRGSTNGGHLSATYAGTTWTTTDMTNYVGTPASAGGAPAAFVQKDGTVGVVTANAANGHVYMTYLPSGG